MIIMTRSITKDHAYNTLGYVIKDEKNHIVLDSDGADISSATQFINDCSTYQKKNVKKEFISTVISPHPDDKLDIKGITKLLKEVQKELKLDNRQFFAVIHQNTSNPHIHVISNRINYENQTWDDHHVAWKCQEACIQLSKKLQLTSAYEKKGTYDKTQAQPKSKFHTENSNNIQYIKNHFLEIKFKATGIDQVFEHLKKNGIDVKISKFRNGLYGVSMKYNDTTAKGSTIDRLLTLIPHQDSYTANPRMQRILENNKLRLEGKRSQENIASDLNNSKNNHIQNQDLIHEIQAQMEHELTRYKNLSSSITEEDDQDFYKRKRRKKEFNI